MEVVQAALHTLEVFARDHHLVVDMSAIVDPAQGAAMGCSEVPDQRLYCYESACCWSILGRPKGSRWKTWLQELDVYMCLREMID